MEDDVCISHLGSLEFNNSVVEEITERLSNSADSLTYSLEEELNLLEQLTQFELGRFLLQNQGFNGYWIDYAISGDHSSLEDDSLEYWLVTKAPVVKATQERFAILQKEIQNRLVSNMSLASIPCGSMSDLLTLDYLNAANVKLTGIDIDPDSLPLVQSNADKINNPSFSINLEQEDAWKLERDADNKFDLITSNGLNIYEPDEKVLIDLYTKFHDALRPGGYLVASFLTKSPMVDSESPWKNFNMFDLTKQKAVFGDLVQGRWQNFWKESQMRDQLEQAGFSEIEIIYDSQGMFPTVVAVRN